MNGREHFRQAEEDIAEASRVKAVGDSAAALFLLKRASVHARLAQVAATVYTVGANHPWEATYREQPPP